MTREERNIAAMMRFYALFNTEEFRQGNFQALYDVLAPDFQDHNPIAGQGPGIQGLQDAFGGFYQAFPDFHIEIADILAQGNKVAVRLIYRGTHRGTFFSFQPTGRSFKIQGMNFIHLNEEGKSTDRWGNADWSGLFQQLGLE